MADLKAEDLGKFVKDAFYVTVGLGVLGFQKAQVQRREFTQQLKGQVNDAREQFGSVSSFLENRVKVVEERLDDVEDRVEDLLDQLEDRLPEQARDVAQQLRKAARDARGQLRELVVRTPANPN
ncbi:MAG: hypothetical protein ACRD0U_02940 [Acidimicrobiales bacterium]